MTICFFGIYKSGYSRSRIIINGLNRIGVNVIECHSDLLGIKKYFDLFIKHWRIRKDYDIMIVGFPGYQTMILAKLITRKKIIYDAFFSIFDCMVLERKMLKPKALKAKYYWFLDWMACKLADRIMLDTDEHSNYFIKLFNIKKEKFFTAHIGASDDIFYPMAAERKNNDFTIIFFGMFIPHQGVEYIIQAAKILEQYNIKFIIIGGGQTKKDMVKLAETLDSKNIEFFGFSPQEFIREKIAISDVCLGAFGGTNKAIVTINNKVFESIAMKKPVITGDSPAIKELFTDRENILLCKQADANDLADKILELKNNQDLREEISQNGYATYKKYATPEIIAKNIIRNIEFLK